MKQAKAVLVIDSGYLECHKMHISRVRNMMNLNTRSWQVIARMAHYIKQLLPVSQHNESKWEGNVKIIIILV